MATAPRRTSPRSPEARSGDAGARVPTSAAAPEEHALRSNLPFYVYLVFIVVSLLNLGVRWPWLGVVRPTILLVGILTIFALSAGPSALARVNSREAKILGALVAYVIVTLPLVVWPGSVLKNNLEMFIRVSTFFFFTAIFVDSPKRLSIFLLVYVSAQLFRCLEPLYLHETTGYWGEKTHLGDGVFMGRLAGVPTDIIGANGLGFLIVSVMPFLYFWSTHEAKLWKIGISLALTLPLLYALSLTSSRSGLVALVVLVVAISFFVKRRLLFLAGTAAVLVFGGKSVLSGDQLARFAGLVGGGGAGGVTAKGRIDGIMNDLHVWMNAPLFGHGLGTSYEANWNVSGAAYISHNLYSEALVTLGIFGAGIFFAFLFSIWRSAQQVYKLTSHATVNGAPEFTGVMAWLPKAMISLIAMCVIFSLSSYGVLEYYWYLFAGLAASLVRLVQEHRAAQPAAAAPTPTGGAPPRRWRGSARA